MASWPELDELKQVLDVTSDDWDGIDDPEDPTRLARLLAAAIHRVKVDVSGGEAKFDADFPAGPNQSLAQAALRMAELLALKPELAAGIGDDPTYRRLLFGHRRAFGVA